MNLPPALPDCPADAADGCGPAGAAKRQQILDGARRAFLTNGFEAASMGEIARAAGVSKGTLYVYFDSKEALFVALVEETKRQTAERLTALDSHSPDVAATLTDFGAALILRMSRPEHIQTLRMVMAVADRIPEPALGFYRAGPAHGAQIVGDYLAALAAEGRLRLADPAEAGWHLLAMIAHPVMTGLLFGSRTAPDAAEARRIAARAVETFLAAHPLQGPAPEPDLGASLRG